MVGVIAVSPVQALALRNGTANRASVSGDAASIEAAGGAP